MALGPVPALAVDPAVAGQELHEPVAPAEEILLHVFPAAEEIPHRLRGLVGHVDRGQLPRPEEADQLRRIPAVRLDPVPRLAGRQGGSDDLAGDAQGRELPVQVVPRGTRLVAGHHRPLALEALEEPPEMARLVGDLAQLGLRRFGPQDPHHDRVLAVIEGHVRGILLHDRPPFACGSVPSPEQPTLLCDRSGRSFHMV